MGSLPVGLVATLCLGLRENSRVMMALRGARLSLDQEIAVQQLDALNLSVWMKTKDAVKGRNRPQSLYKELTKPQNAQSEFATFESYEELKQAIERSKHV